MYDQVNQENDWKEMFLGVFRVMICDFKNANWKFPGGALRYQDIFKLSYDKEESEERPLTFKEAKALFGSRIKKDGK